MVDAEIKRDEPEFLKTCNWLLKAIIDLLMNVALGRDYDDENTKKLFRVHKFIQGIDK
jgi:hypothetical protein